MTENISATSRIWVIDSTRSQAEEKVYADIAFENIECYFFIKTDTVNKFDREQY